MYYSFNACSLSKRVELLKETPKMPFNWITKIHHLCLFTHTCTLFIRRTFPRLFEVLGYTNTPDLSWFQNSVCFAWTYLPRITNIQITLYHCIICWPILILLYDSHCFDLFLNLFLPKLFYRLNIKLFKSIKILFFTTIKCLLNSTGHPSYNFCVGGDFEIFANLCQ